MIDSVKTFSGLSEEFVEVYLRYHPVRATEVGLHDYDERLPDDSPDGFRERAAWLLDLEQRLVASVPWEELPAAQRVDYALLRSRVATLRAGLEEVRFQARNPALYPETALMGIFLLMARPFAPLEERKEALLARLMAVPGYLAAAAENLQQVPEICLEVASEVNLSGPAFVDDLVRSLLRSFPGEAERIEHAASRARVGFLQYQDFLDHRLGGRVVPQLAIGERWMNFLLEHDHLLELDCAALEALGREHVERTRALLEEEARRLDRARSWRELRGEARLHHPEPLRLREAYAAEVERARRFTLEKRLAPLPPGEVLEIIDTPVFERGVIARAAYLPPAPFDDDQTGYLYVTPVEIGRRREEQERQLEGHCYAGLPLAVVHEAFPGHHVQLGHANRAGSRLRRLADSSLFAEGWALYGEELMHRQGFFPDPITRLLQLNGRLERACHAVIDVGLQTGRMTVAQAVSFLVEHAGLERMNAEAEVRRCALRPAQPMSGLVGMLQLLEIRAEAERRLGPRFDLHDFHAALLACGTLQPALAREDIWERLPRP